MAEEHPAPRPAAGPVEGGAYLQAEGGGLALSAEAYRFHLYALTDSAVAGEVGTVRAAYVEARLGGEAAVRELLAHGLWERTDGGYLVVDEEALATVVATYADAARIAESCVDGSGHFPDEASPGFCARCHGPLAAMPAAEAPPRVAPASTGTDRSMPQARLEGPPRSS